jgi:hypothetical protein
MSNRNQNYSGNFFGAEFLQHVYEPTEKTTKHLLEKYNHTYKKGDKVRVRKPHKKSKYGTIYFCFYTSEGQYGGRFGGGTYRAYRLIEGGMYYEHEIKELT